MLLMLGRCMQSGLLPVRQWDGISKLPDDGCVPWFDSQTEQDPVFTNQSSQLSKFSSACWSDTRQPMHQDILALFAWSVIKPLTHDGLTNYWDTQALINIHGGLFKTCPAEGKMDLQRNKMIHSVFPPLSRTVSIKTASMSLMIHTDAQYLSDQWMGNFLLLVWPVNRAENTDNSLFL